ncbi:response regulator transcription factor [Streptomyces platensis]|uniref:response regulator transcription factor n=1 Tax=Streptomyces platensis TaxID=58346 RepID=UPI003323DB4E
MIDGYLLSARTSSGRRQAGDAPSEELVWLESLSGREREVLILISEGLTNREIGLRLMISAETVKDHVRAILVKLGTDNRMRAAAMAWQADLTMEPARAA